MMMMMMVMIGLDIPLIREFRPGPIFNTCSKVKIA